MPSLIEVFDVRYTIRYRETPSIDWLILGTDIVDLQYFWDSTTLPDGEYEIQVGAYMGDDSSSPVWSEIRTLNIGNILEVGAPVLTLLAYDVDNIEVQTSEFVPPVEVESMPHVATQWQVSRNSGFTDIAYDSGDDEENLLYALLSISGEAGTQFWVRARHVGLSEEETEDPDVDPDPVLVYSPWSNVVTINTSSKPNTPTVSMGTIAETTAVINTSAYSDPLSRPHLRTQWQVERAISETTRVFELTSEDDLVSTTATELLSGQSHRARARHVNDLGAASNWSAWVDFNTVAGAPGTPQILSVTEPTDDNFLITASAFSAGNVAPPHQDSYWQVATDDAFTALVVDSGWDAVNLTTYPTNVFDRESVYYGRVKYRDTDDTESDWSETFVFSLRRFFFDFAETAIGDAPADWHQGALNGGIIPWAGTFRVVQKQGAHRGKALELDVWSSWVPSAVFLNYENHYLIPRPRGEFAVPVGAAKTRFQISHWHHESMVSAGGPMHAGLICKAGDQYYRAWIAYQKFSTSSVNGTITGIPKSTRDAVIVEGEWYQLEMRYFSTLRSYVIANPNPGVALIRVERVVPNIIATLTREKTGEQWTVGGFLTDHTKAFIPGEFGVFGHRTEGVKVWDWVAIAEAGRFQSPRDVPTPVIRSPFAGQTFQSQAMAMFKWDHPWQDNANIRYEGQRWTGEEWVPLFGLQPQRNTLVELNPFRRGMDNKIRIRAYLASQPEPYSPWVESQEFTVAFGTEGRSSIDFTGMTPGNRNFSGLFTHVGGNDEAWMVRQDDVVPIGQRAIVVSGGSGGQAIQGIFNGPMGRVMGKARIYALRHEVGLVALARNDTRPGREHLLGTYYLLRILQGSRIIRLQRQREYLSSHYRLDTLYEAQLPLDVPTGTYFNAQLEVLDGMIHIRVWRDEHEMPESWDFELPLSEYGDEEAKGWFGFYGTGGTWGYVASRATEFDTLSWEQYLSDFEDPIGPEPCAVEATLYADDRETIDWQVTDDITWKGDSGEAEPYLISPTNYGEQILDFASGSAKISQVSFGIIDFIRERTKNYHVDKQLGWVVQRLADAFGRSDIQGKRLRLRRFINEALGWVTLGDGPAGAPIMNTYSDFTLSIRDVREWERKLSAFEFTTGFSAFPRGLLEGWGTYGEGQQITPPVTTFPAKGVLYRDGFDTSPTNPRNVVYIKNSAGNAFGWGAPGFETEVPENIIYNEAVGKLFDGVWDPDAPTGTLGQEWTYPHLVFHWRPDGSTGPYTAMPGITMRDLSFTIQGGSARIRRGNILQVSQNMILEGSDDGEGGINVDVVRSVMMNWYDPAILALAPTHGQHIEFYYEFVGSVPTSNEYPFYVEGITLGQFIKNTYDGIYSERDENGDPIPTGIRYNAFELLKLTEPIRARITSPVTNVREYLEKKAYGGAGYTPALDHDFMIAPQTEVIPTTAEVLNSLTVIDDTIAEPEPSWSHGSKVVNILTYKYKRYYYDPVNSQSIDALSSQDIIFDFRNSLSLRRNGEQKIEIDGELFSAVGNFTGETLENPEMGAILAERRRINMFDRLKFGTPTFQLNVWRVATAHLRAGDFVRVNITWFPEYSTQARHMDVLAQIIAIADIDCNIRRPTFESCGPWPLVES